MKYLNSALKNRAAAAEFLETLYDKNVEKKIRAKYSVKKELIILRQFAEYIAFVEKCKAEVKAEMEIED